MCEEISQNEEFRIRGHWWRPDGQHRPSGELNYRERRIELQLLGAFDDAIGDTPFDRNPDPMEMEVIHGESVKGTPVTLLNSFYTAVQHGGNFFELGPVPVKTSTLVCNGMLLGVHMQSESQPLFRKCCLTIPSLEAWLCDRPFEATYLPELAGMTAKYLRPPHHVFDVGGTVGTIRIVYSFVPPGWPTNDYVIRHRAHLEIEPTEAMPLAWFRETHLHTQRLFTLLFGQSVETTRLRLIPASGDGNGVLVYGAHRHIEQRDLNGADFVFRYPDVAEWFATMLQSWFTESERIRHTINLLFSSIREPAPFLDSRFLPLVQAAEVYSRAMAPGPIVPKPVFKRVRKAIEKTIPETINDAIPEEDSGGLSEEDSAKLRDAIVGKLRHANEPPLKQRLESLIKEIEPDTVALFCNDSTEFVRGIVDTRNYHTHYSAHYDRILRHGELHWATVKLQVMLNALLLKRLGVPETAIQAAFRKNDRLAGERSVWRNVSELGSPH